MSELSIRKSRIEDIEYIVELGRKYCPPEYISHSEIMEGFAIEPMKWSENWWEKFEYFLKEHFEYNEEYIIVIEEDATILGYMIIDIEKDYEFSEKYGMIHDMLVDPSYQRKGLGHQLIEFGKDYFKKMGCKYIFFESGLNNHKAHDFFEKNEFEVISKVFYQKLD